MMKKNLMLITVIILIGIAIGYLLNANNQLNKQVQTLSSIIAIEQTESVNSESLSSTEEVNKMQVVPKVNNVNFDENYVDLTIKIVNAHSEIYSDYFIDFLVGADYKHVYTALPYKYDVTDEKGARCLNLNYKLYIADQGNEFIIRVIEPNTATIAQIPEEVVSSAD